METRHVALANAARRVDDRGTSRCPTWHVVFFEPTGAETEKPLSCGRKRAQKNLSVLGRGCFLNKMLLFRMRAPYQL